MKKKIDFSETVDLSAEDHQLLHFPTKFKDERIDALLISQDAIVKRVQALARQISADYWHDTRSEIRRRLGGDIHILPQCSAAGDQSPHIMIGEKAEERMYSLMWPEDTLNGGRWSFTAGLRKQIAVRIADAVTSVYPYMKDHIEWSPGFEHQMEVAELSRRLIDTGDVSRALRESGEWKKQYNQLLGEIKENPGMREEPRWYKEITIMHTLAKRGQSVQERYELQAKQPKMPVEIHVVRIGEMVMATNPFELYLDYGMRIKARSPAVQTFVVQLAGSGSYLPTSRSIAGGAYGAVPASTLIGPEGGQELVEKTLEMCHKLW